MSEWTHPICELCWHLREPNRVPVRIKDAQKESCCFCGTATQSGIYVRQDPKTTLCRGTHIEL